MFNFIISFFQKKTNIPIEKFDYVDRLIGLLNESKYCQVIDIEEELVKELYKRLKQEKLNGYIKLSRMSNKAIDFYYKTYPIGRFKLSGKKTWMQFSPSLYKTKVLKDEPFEIYLDSIDEWIKYIKNQKL